MRNRSPFIALAFALSAPAFAQVPPPIATPLHRIEWAQSAPSLADAQGYSYNAIIDASSDRIPLAEIKCGGIASPFTCNAAFPAVAPGEHTIALTALAVIDGVRLESPPSAAVAFRLVLAPSTPTGIRFVP